MNEHTACSNGNMFGGQKATQEDEVFSVGLEHLAEDAKKAFFTECT